MLRLLLGTLIQQRMTNQFPIGTLVINVTGSFLLALILEYALATPAMSAETRAMLTTGFCGGYTTFSTFGYESARLMEEGDWRRAALYVSLSVVLSFAAVFVGLSVAREALALRRAI